MQMRHLRRSASRGVDKGFFDNQATKTMTQENYRSLYGIIMLSFGVKLFHKSLSMVRYPIGRTATEERGSIGFVIYGEDPSLEPFIREQVAQPKTSIAGMNPSSHSIFI
jgi:hypothetical protein